MEKNRLLQKKMSFVSLLKRITTKKRVFRKRSSKIKCVVLLAPLWVEMLTEMLIPMKIQINSKIKKKKKVGGVQQAVELHKTCLLPDL